MQIDKPLRCLAFSPNWYLPQICSLSASGLLAFGSNNDVFIIDYKTKDFYAHVYQLQSSGKLKSNTKVTALEFSHQSDILIMGNSDGNLLLVELSANRDFAFLYNENLSPHPICYIIKDELDESNSPGRVVVVDQIGQVFTVCMVNKKILEMKQVICRKPVLPEDEKEEGHLIPQAA